MDRVFGQPEGPRPFVIRAEEYRSSLGTAVVRAMQSKTAEMYPRPLAQKRNIAPATLAKRKQQAAQKRARKVTKWARK